MQETSKKKHFGSEGNLYKERQKLIKPIQDKVYNAIQDVAQKGSYAFVLDSASDIAVLFQLLVNEYSNIVIYDTENQLVENSVHNYKVINSIQKLAEGANLLLLSKFTETTNLLFNNCIDFANNDLSKGEIFEYQYFNNPNATMRWIYPKALKYPSFLTLYNASGLKSKLIRLNKYKLLHSSVFYFLLCSSSDSC